MQSKKLSVLFVLSSLCTIAGQGVDEAILLYRVVAAGQVVGLIFVAYDDFFGLNTLCTARRTGFCKLNRRMGDV